MSQAIVTYGQTLVDIAIQEYGCAEAIFLLKEDNPQVNMDGSLLPGLKLIIRDDVPQLTLQNIISLEGLKRIDFRPATGSGSIQENTYVDDDYMDAEYVE